ncbi:putative Peptidase M23B [Candidatus Sulfobium mesophilum]|uniref:Putative Peptidase M23B n=1 Tax=Candidatus Sulfobium mesophilum TaxID=2016548 RepID=A0A2U3QGG4_9BACT|nr:putative Peptidase M23B [Candidatus Sulfobium mesophilum]
MFLVFPLLFVLLFSSVSLGTTHEEEYKKIQQKMSEQKKKLRETQERESSILNDLEGVNMKLGKIEAELNRHRKDLRSTETEISAVTSDIENMNSVLSKQKEWLKRKLMVMQKFGYSGDMLTLLMSAEDISQMMRIWKYLENIALYEHRVIGDYRETLSRYNEKYERLRVLKVQLKANAERVTAMEQQLAEQKRSKVLILSSVRREKASQQKMLAELKEASKRILDLIEKSSKTDTYTGAAAGFTRLKGKLPWPAEGRIAVPYGAQKDPEFSTPIFRNGVHIQTSSNSEARTVSEGKVIFAEWFKGFGQLVIVNHGNGYHTLYGNLSEIFSHVGDIIRESQVIGRVGTSGILNAPGLYFEIRYKGKPLDPAQWLRHRRG